MADGPFDEIRRAIGFEKEDAANVRALAPQVMPLIPEVVRCFYEQLLQHPGARVVFTGGEKQIRRQHATVAAWLEGVLTGPYDPSHWEKLRAIGAANVSVGLPQHYMFVGMALIERDLKGRIRAAGVENVDEKLESLRKVLTLDLAVMLESYKDAYSQQVREFERGVAAEKLTRTQHLAEIGQLAASLAHEIKNPLAGISGAIQIIRDGMVPGDPHLPIVAEILGQIGRLDATVKDLLEYARPTPPTAVPISVGAIVARVLNVLREEPALQRVHIKCNRGAADTTLRVDDTQIERLLLNLIINSAHASEDGGAIWLGISRDDNQIRLIIKDEGRGMPPEIRERAFEPFFTTKARGTGLGLSICRRIVEAHGGHIELESEVGCGTSVIVTLPHNPGGRAPGTKA